MPCSTTPARREDERNRCSWLTDEVLEKECTSTAFVGAGLVCAHHLAFPLYWHPAADAAACIVQLGIASTAGALRAKTGRHFITDVAAEAVLGLVTGFVGPTLMYYRQNRAHRGDVAARGMLVPAVARRSVGLGVVGIF